MRTKVLYMTTALVLCGVVVIWFNKAYFLSVPNFFAWFVAAVTIVVLVASIIIKNVPETGTRDGGDFREREKADRREFPRIRHRLKKRPCLRIDAQELAVLDMSEQGLRFASDAGMHFKDWVRGRLVFPDESTLSINGIVVRRQAGSVSLQLITPIPADLLEKQAEHRLLESDELSDG